MDYDEPMRNRLKRIEGQVRSIYGMMDAHKDCKEVVTQLSAVRAAIDRLMVLMIGTNMGTCLRGEMESGGQTDKVIHDAIELLMKTR